MPAAQAAAALLAALLGAALPGGARATDLAAVGRLDTTTALQHDQIVAVANDGLDRRDRVQGAALVKEVTNLVAQQVGGGWAVGAALGGAWCAVEFESARCHEALRLGPP